MPPASKDALASYLQRQRLHSKEAQQTLQGTPRSLCPALREMVQGRQEQTSLDWVLLQSIALHIHHRMALPNTWLMLRASPAKHEDLNLAGASSYQKELPKQLQLVEAEIDWAGDTSVQPQEHGRPNGSLATGIDPGSCSDDSGGEYDPRDPSLQQQGRRDADGSMAAKVDPGAWSESNSGEEYDPEGAALEIDTDDFSPRRHASGRGQRGHVQPAGPQKRSQEHGPVQGSSDGGASPGDATSMVENATLRFVKAIVNPLYAAQVCTVPAYLASVISR